jgi:hypothetical protein
MAKRLGWLGPALVLVGLAVGSLGVWYMVHAKPTAGDVVETVAIDPRSSIVVRSEVGEGGRTFVELHVDDELKWQTFVPAYGGHPHASGIAFSENVVSIRIVRNARAEIFAISMRDASKLGGLRLAPEHGPIDPAATGPVTLTDHARSYEVVSGPDWHQLVAIDLPSGNALWKVELGAAAVLDGGVEGGNVWLVQVGGQRRVWGGKIGAELPVKSS